MGGWFNEFCPVGCEDDCAAFKLGNFAGCGVNEGLGYSGYNGATTNAVGPNPACQENNVVGAGQMAFLWCGKPTTTTTTCVCKRTTTGTTTTTTEDHGHVCKHYESEDTCPLPRCSWDGDACADPPCSSRTSEADCCGDCEWEVDQCKPAIFKACPDEGKAGTNVCPEGCTFVDNCEQCEFAAGVWKKDYSKAPWPAGSGARPQGCFRNRKFNVKCNKFEPGSKYPSGQDKVGTKKGKWPICKVIEPPKKCKGDVVAPCVEAEIAKAEWKKPFFKSEERAVKRCKNTDGCLGYFQGKRGFAILKAGGRFWSAAKKKPNGTVMSVKKCS